MAFLASVRLRLFLVCWILFSLFFSTNIVREHYPAFTLIEHGNFRCDEYQGWHAISAELIDAGQESIHPQWCLKGRTRRTSWIAPLRAAVMGAN